MKMDIGINEKDRTDIVTGLMQFLASTYTLYLKTQNFHWNVVGPAFYQHHLLFESQYKEMATAIDEIAERVRALGVRAPASMREFSELSVIKEDRSVMGGNEMVRTLLEGQEMLVRSARSLLPIVKHADDEPTLNLLTMRMEVHEKNAWMLRSVMQ